MAQTAVAFILGLFAGLLFSPRSATIKSNQDIHMTCPKVPACPDALAAHPDDVFVKGIESYQAMLEKCNSEVEHGIDRLDSCRMDNLNLKSDNEYLRNK
jgi:predicted nucleotide-binding protein (sugar kinase/HSP70/actin superfamily)